MNRLHRIFWQLEWKSKRIFSEKFRRIFRSSSGHYPCGHHTMTKCVQPYQWRRICTIPAVGIMDFLKCISKWDEMDFAADAVALIALEDEAWNIDGPHLPESWRFR